MKLFISIFALIILLQNPLFSQCIIGDCNNGFGEYNFEDSSKYEGYWKNGKFHGIIANTAPIGSCLTKLFFASVSMLSSAKNSAAFSA